MIADDRHSLLENIHAMAGDLIVTPDLAIGGEVANALDALLKAYLELVTAAHTSSTDEYALQDLPMAERSTLAKARHMVTILQQIAG